MAFHHQVLMKTGMNWNITAKLILVNTVIFLIVGGIFWVVNASFHNIQDSLTTTIDEDVEQVIYNARVGRELNRTFSEINAFIRSISDESDDIDLQSQTLLETMHALMSEDALDTRLKPELQNFRRNCSYFSNRGKRFEPFYLSFASLIMIHSVL